LICLHLLQAFVCGVNLKLPKALQFLQNALLAMIPLSNTYGILQSVQIPVPQSQRSNALLPQVWHSISRKKMSGFRFEKDVENDTQQYQICQIELQMNCLSSFHLGEKVGEGSYGAVIQADNVILKLIPLSSAESEFCAMTSPEKFQEEVNVSKEISDKKLGPIFIRSFICEATATSESSHVPKPIRVGVIVQEKWDLTLQTYAKLFKRKYKRKRAQIYIMVKSIIDRYLTHHITHKDVKMNNIMVKVNSKNDIEDMTFIDFGAIELNDNRNEKVREQIMWDGFEIEDETIC